MNNSITQEAKLNRAHDYVTLVETEKYPIGKKFWWASEKEIAQKRKEAAERKLPFDAEKLRSYPSKGINPLGTGHGKTYPFSSMDDILALLEYVVNHPHCCMIYGYIPGTEDGTLYKIVPKKYILESRVGTDREGDNTGAQDINGEICYARIKANYHNSNCMPFDFDEQPQTPSHLCPNTTHDYAMLLDQVFPRFIDTDVIGMGSSSARLLVGGVQATSKNKHLLILVNDIGNEESVKRFKTNISNHCHAKKLVMKDPNTGDDSPAIIDTSVYSPHGQMYDGMPSIGQPDAGVPPPGRAVLSVSDQTLERLNAGGPRLNLGDITEIPGPYKTRKPGTKSGGSDADIDRESFTCETEFLDRDHNVYKGREDMNAALDDAENRTGEAKVSGFIPLGDGFRSSASDNGILRRFDDGTLYIHDHGHKPHGKNYIYCMSDDEARGVLFDKVTEQKEQNEQADRIALTGEKSESVPRHKGEVRKPVTDQQVNENGVPLPPHLQVSAQVEQKPLENASVPKMAPKPPKKKLSLAAGLDVARAKIDDFVTSAKGEEAHSKAQSDILTEALAFVHSIQDVSLMGELGHRLKDQFKGMKPADWKLIEDPVKAEAAKKAFEEDKSLDLPEGVSFRVNEYPVGVNEQLEHFKGCMYVRDKDKILDPDGDFLDEKRFQATYGGRPFVTREKDDGSDSLTKSAWDAYHGSSYIKRDWVHGDCFRPELKPREIILKDNRRLINSFVPCFGAKIDGGVEPFLLHICKILPNQKDQSIFLSYLAGMVQKAGTKFKWCVLLQGAEGSGKTMFQQIMAYCLGERYVHVVDPKDVSNKFNAWVQGHLAFIINELHVDGKQEIADAMKPLITDDRIGIQGKGADQKTGDNRGNFLAFSNHKDAVLKNRNDRRYCVFYAAQQDVEDFERDDMGSEYFSRLFKWLEKKDGYGKIANFLHNFKIPKEINFMHRAPDTSATEEAILMSRGGAEQAVAEAVDAEVYGFRSDILCTTATKELIHRQWRDMSPRAVSLVLKNLGYVKHPALPGRMVVRNGNDLRHSFYVKRGSDLENLATGQDVLAKWLEDNRQVAV